MLGKLLEECIRAGSGEEGKGAGRRGGVEAGGGGHFRTSPPHHLTLLLWLHSITHSECRS